MHDHHDNSQHNAKPEDAQGNNKPMMRLENGDTIPEGGYGRTRDGRKVGPMRFDESDYGPEWPWFCPEGGNWAPHGEDGTVGGAIGALTSGDIIAAWDEQPTTGTLKELIDRGLKPGDVVQCVDGLGCFRNGKQYPIIEGGGIIDEEGDKWPLEPSGLLPSSQFRIISRAPTPPPHRRTMKAGANGQARTNGTCLRTMCRWSASAGFTG